MSHAPPPGPTPPAITVDALRAEAGGVVVVDVRSPEEFADGHKIGAVNIPLDDLPARLSEVPVGARVVAVCTKGGGRSQSAAQTLRARGWDAAFLDGGWLAWRARL